MINTSTCAGVIILVTALIFIFCMQFSINIGKSETKLLKKDVGFMTYDGYEKLLFIQQLIPVPVPNAGNAIEVAWSLSHSAKHRVIAAHHVLSF